MRLLLAVVVIFAAIFHYGGAQCPKPRDISPCGCSYPYPNEPYLVCINVVDFDNLKRIFANSAGYNYDAITLQAFTVPYLPHNLFKDSPTNSLQIISVDVNRIFDAPPVGLESMKILELINVKIMNGANWEFLSTITALEKLTISNIPMKVIKKDFGQYVTANLKYLRLHEASIRSIKKGAFEKLINLKELYIESSGLSEIRRDMFPNPFKSIHKISLNWNGDALTTLPDGIFSNMPNLSEVTLSYCGFKTINSNQFSGLSRLLYLEIKDNTSFKCDLHLCWLKGHKLIQFDGECYAPEEFKYRSFKDLTRTELQCR